MKDHTSIMAWGGKQKFYTCFVGANDLTPVHWLWRLFCSTWLLVFIIPLDIKKKWEIKKNLQAWPSAARTELLLDVLKWYGGRTSPLGLLLWWMLPPSRHIDYLFVENSQPLSKICHKRNIERFSKSIGTTKRLSLCSLTNISYYFTINSGCQHSSPSQLVFGSKSTYKQVNNPRLSLAWLACFQFDQVCKYNK